MKRQHSLRNLDELEHSDVSFSDSLGAGLFTIFIVAIALMIIASLG